MKKSGEFLIQKEKHKTRQRIFDDVKKACSLKEHTFWIDNARVTTTNKDLLDAKYYTNAYCIIEMKHGFALAFLCTKDCPSATLISNRDIQLYGNYLTAPKIWCQNVFIPSQNISWNFLEEWHIELDRWISQGCNIQNNRPELESLPNYFDVKL